MLLQRPSVWDIDILIVQLPIKMRKLVGRAISKAIESGLVIREELFVLSKLWNKNMKPEEVIPALDQTLKDPWFGVSRYVPRTLAMAKLSRTGFGRRCSQYACSSLYS